MAKKKKEAAAAGPKKSVWKSPWTWVLIAMVSMALFPETVLVFVAGMVPSLVALMVDTSKEKHAFKTVSYLNLAGTFIVAIDMWMTGDSSLARAMEVLADPVNWAIMFGMAGLGWMLYFTIPPIVLSYKGLANESKMKKLKEKQLKLTKEWGTEVTNTAPDIPEELIRDAEEAMKPIAEQKRLAEEKKKKEEQAQLEDGSNSQ